MGLHLYMLSSLLMTVLLIVCMYFINCCIVWVSTEVNRTQLAPRGMIIQMIWQIKCHHEHNDVSKDKGHLSYENTKEACLVVRAPHSLGSSRPHETCFTCVLICRVTVASCVLIPRCRAFWMTIFRVDITSVPEKVQFLLRQFVFGVDTKIQFCHTHNALFLSGRVGDSKEF